MLQRSPISPTERFFEIGGKDSLADSMFSEIAKVCGRELPSATICHAPTIAALAAVLEQHDLPRYSPFVPLKPGSEKPPILIAHGVGGRASFSELARHIRTEHPVYGIQAKGVDGLEEPFESIEDMAGFYLEALAQLQPEGPYILIGYSFGGLVALEMARRLSADGKQVALLVLIDTYPHPRYFPPGQRLLLFTKRIRGHISDKARMPIRGAFSSFVAGFKRRLHIAGGPKRGTPPPGTSRLSFSETTLHVRESDFLAMKHYRPLFYRGKIRFVRPQANSYLPNDPTAVWKNLATELAIETVPGDHLGMVGTHFESLAALLTRYVEEAVDTK